MPERKYAMTKLGAGDYLLPSNDGRTIWRIHRYTDGPTLGLDIPKDREFWAVSRWTGNGDVVDPDADSWEWCETLLSSRQDAINVALKAQPR